MPPELASDLERLATEVFECQMPYGLALLDEHYTALWVSPGFLRLLDYEEGDVVGRQMTDLTNVEDLAQLMPVGAEMLELAPSLKAGPYPVWAVEIPVRMRAGTGRWVAMSVTGRYVRKDGLLLLCYRLAADRHAQAAVIGALMGDVSLDETLERLTELARTQLGAARAWVVHDMFGTLEIVRGDEADVGIKDLHSHLAQVRRGDIHPAPHNRGNRWVGPVIAENPSGATGHNDAEPPQTLGLLVMELEHELNPYEKYLLNDISRLVALVLNRAVIDRSLRLAATTDDLTGLLNRRAFEALLTSAQSDSAMLPLTVFFLDLNGFKKINDVYGHAVGDEVLVTVARRLRSALRDSDSAARSGGDEFSMLCPGIDASAAEKIGDRILGALRHPIHVSGVTLEITASLGAATATSPEAVADLMRRADSTMYANKRSIQA